MALSIEIRGRMLPLHINDDLDQFANKVNLARQAGMTFIMASRTSDDAPVGINVPEILIFEPIDDVDAFVG